MLDVFKLPSLSPGVSGDLLINIFNSIGTWLLVLFLVGFLFYIYFSFVYYKIGKKAGLKSPGISWMPYLGKLAVIFESSKMHWWPWLLLVGGIFFSLSFIIVGFIIGNITAIKTFSIAGLIFLVFTYLTFFIITIIWHWRTYVEVNQPGWFVLIPVGFFLFGFLIGLLVPIIYFIFVVLGFLSHIILVSIAAFSKNKVKNNFNEKTL
jgi:hypothetical protein